MPIELISWPKLDLTKIAKMNIMLTVKTLKFLNN